MWLQYLLQYTQKWILAVWFKIYVWWAWVSYQDLCVISIITIYVLQEIPCKSIKRFSSQWTNKFPYKGNNIWSLKESFSWFHMGYILICSLNLNSEPSKSWWRLSKSDE